MSKKVGGKAVKASNADAVYAMDDLVCIMEFHVLYIYVIY
jgi:hypothetical protein